MKDLFCVKCAAVTPHSSEVDQNGEYVFSCNVLDENNNPHCFVKFPRVDDKAELEGLMQEHLDINQPIAEAMKDVVAQQGILKQVLEDGSEVTLESAVVE